MKKIIFIIVSALITLSFYSCYNTLGDEDVYTDRTYFEISFDGQTYNEIAAYQLGNPLKIENSPSFELMFPEVQAGKYHISSSLTYLNKDSAFKFTKTGVYRLVQNDSDIVKNMDFRLSILSSDSAIVNLVSLGVNNVTEIRLLTELGAMRNYVLCGTFSAVYINTKTNTTLPVSGKYRLCVATYK